MAAPASAAAVASSSSSSYPPRPSNLLTIFQAHFHTRRGNELTFQSGHDLDLAGVEWKVLPSGSHALASDLLWFTLPDSAEGEGHGYDKVGVACFRNRKLTGSAEEEGDAETEQMGDGNSDQQEARRLDERGARMTAVGVIVASQSSIPSHQLAAVLPHLEALSLLADASSLQPRNHSILKTFLESHRFNTASSSACFPSLHTRSPAPLTRWPESLYDPLLDLPSIVNALGLILPDVLRSLLTSGTRLLIFSPQGVETRSAASIAWAVAEIVEAALTSADEGEEGDDEAPLSPKQQRLHQHIPQVRGIIGLHEISNLQDEEGRRKQAATMSGVKPKRGWIAWTTDKLYLDKADLYDCLLDLTPLSQGISSSAVGAGQSLTVLSAYDGSSKAGGGAPAFYRVERPDVSLASGHTSGSASKRPLPAKLKKQTWHARDFSVYRDNELKAVAYESRPKRHGRRGSRGSVPSRSNTADGDVQPLPRGGQGMNPGQGALFRQRSRSIPITGQMSRYLSILIDLVHYYLSTRAILPRPWRFHLHDRIRLGGESYGYVPLSIRPDGGVQAGLMLLPEDSESGSDSEVDDSGSDGEGVASKASTLRAGRLPLERTASRDGAQKSSPGLLQVHPASSISPATHRRQERNPFSDLEDSDDDDDDRSYGSDMDSPPMRSPSSSRSGGGDLDPILAACGASPSGHSSSRRAARSSFSGSSASGHSLGRRKSSSSRTSSRRAGRDRAWSDEVASAALIASGQAGVPGPGLGPKAVKGAMLGTDRRQAQGSDASRDGTADLNGSTATLTPASPGVASDGAGRARLDPKDATSPRTRSSSGKQLQSAPRLVPASDGDASAAQVLVSLDPRETCLARAIFAAWAEWLHELVEALETLRSPPPLAAVTKPRGRQRSFSDASLLSGGPAGQLGEDFTGEGAGAEEDLPPLTSREIYAVANLSARLKPDADLVRAWTGREVRTVSPWRFWSGWTG